MTIALLSLFGIVVGALLQYIFTRHLENKRHYRDLRTQAYMDYLKSVAEQAHAAQSDPSRMPDVFTRTADAKARICLYGSSKAIQAFAKFDKLGATMGTNQQRKAFIEMVSTMRSDSGGDSGANVQDLEIVLLGGHDKIT